MLDYTKQLPWETPAQAQERLQAVAEEEARIDAIQEIIDEEEAATAAQP